MSKSIEERIVQMSFKNDNFQKNVSDTMSSLDKLKASLDMSGAKTKFGELATAANGVRLDGLSAQVDTLNSKFSGLQVVALGALAAIGSKAADLAVQWGKNAFGSMTEAARSGFAEYELKMGSIQTILANTQKYGTTLDDVNQQLDTLNKYADRTIYNFGDMTRNIGLFTNAGLSLETSVDMIKGFSNAAAASGANAQAASEAAYQLSQALNTGTIRLMDWRSLSQRGIGNANMQEGLIQIASAMGQFNDSTTSANAAQDNFNGSLETGWLSSEVMSGYLKVLAQDNYENAKAMALSIGLTEEQADAMAKQAVTANEAAKKVRTLSQLMGTLSEAAGSSWSESFQILFGDFKEATDLFTMLSDEIGGYMKASGDARNAQLQLWKDMGGYKAIVDAISNAFKALHSILDPITKAFREVFPPSWGATLAQISFAIRDFTAGLILSEKASENLGKVFKMVFTGLKFVLDTVGGAFQIFFAIIGAGFRLIGSLVGLVTPLIGWLISIVPPAKDAGEATESFADKITKLINGGIGPIISWLQQLGKGFGDFLSGLNAADKLDKVGEGFRRFKADVGAVIDLLTSGKMTDVRNAMNLGFGKGLIDTLLAIRNGAIAVGEAIGNFFSNIKTSGKTAGDIIGNVWDYLKGIAKDAGPAFENMGKAIEKALSGIQIEHVLAAINTGVLLAVGVGVKKMADSIRGIFDNVGDILGSFSKSLDGVTGVLSDMQKKLKADMLIRIAGAIGILAISLAILAGIDPDRLASAAVGMGATLGALFVAMKVLDKISEESTSWKDTAKLVLIGVVLIQLATAVTILANAMRIMGQLSWEELLKGLIGLAAAMGALVGAAKIMSGFEKEIIKSAGAMILMAIAILALAGAVAIFGNMPLDVLIQGGIAVAVALGVLVGAAVLLNKYAPDMVLSAVGLMAMAAALNMLILPITTLGLLPFDVLLQGMIAVGLMLGGLVLAAQAMSEIAPKMAIAAVGLMAMAVAINMLMGPVLIMGALDFGTLVQGLFGLAAVITILVVAANSMTGAIAGAGAMIVMAAAVLVLAAAVKIIGSMPIEQIIQGVLGIAAAMLIIGGAAALLGLMSPALVIGAAALMVVGLAMLAMSGAVVILAIGLTMLGPALLIVAGGLMGFAKVAPKIAEAVPAFLGIGAGLLAFGLGAAVAGAGILILGVGLVVLGAGLALIGIFGPIGTIALTSFVKALGRMGDQIPNMLAMSGTLTLLGAAVLVLGVGMLALGIGALGAATALMMMAALGPALTPLILGLLDLIPVALQKFGEGLVALAQVVGNAIPMFVEQFTQLLLSVLNAIQVLTPVIIETLLVMLQAMLDGIVAAVPMFVDAGLQLIVGILNGIANNIGAVVDAGFRVVTEFMNGISRNIPSLIRSAINMIISFVDGLANGIRDNQKRMEEAAGNLASAIIDGLTSGITNGADAVLNAIGNVAEGAIDWAKSLFGIKSPSRVFKEIGGYLTEGQAEGMLDNIGMVKNASEKIAKETVSSLQNGISGFGMESMLGLDADPVITPVFDLSQLQAGASAINGMLSNPKLNVDGMRDTAVATRDDIQKSDDDRAESYNDQAPIQFTQINNSPKALSNAEIYRRTKNQLSVAKGALTTANAKST